MPSDSNGVYTLPDGYLAVTGETILASQHNPPLEDLASSMTQRMMRTGATPMTGPLKLEDGTVSAPSLTMASATSLGWYKTADGWGFSIGGSKVAEITSGGIKKGARYIGELIPFTGTTPPAYTVFPYGQTLSRTTYADLWAFAQTEIANGNAFYNNGNGTTTFGIGDMRGRVFAGRDGMGGVLAGRLTSTYLGSNPDIIGNFGGSEYYQLAESHLPSLTKPLSLTRSVDTSLTVNYRKNSGFNGGGGNTAMIDMYAISDVNQNASVTFGGWTQPVFTGTVSFGGGNAHGNLQPTMLGNFVLFAGA